MLHDEIQKDCLTFCHNIKWMRLHRKLSKKKMAEILKISVGTLTKIENGMLPPRLTIEIFFNFQNHFGIRPADQLSRRLGEDDLP